MIPAMSDQDSTVPGTFPVDARRPSALRNELAPWLAAVLVLALVSVAVRLPYLDRPLSDRHDWITAQSLIALEILQAQGLRAHAFSIPQTYPGEANRQIMNAGIRLIDSRGIGYYTSFPPFSIIFPHLVFKYLDIPVSVASLQGFNLVLHALASCCLFLLLRRMGRGAAGANLAALAGAAVFQLFPLNLWYLGHTYSWDTFWHFLWVPWLWLALDFAVADDAPRPTQAALLGVCTFALAYSEFIGAICAATLAAILLARGWRRNLWAIVALGAGIALPLALTVAQYSWLAGPKALEDALVYAFKERSFLMSGPKARPQMIEMGSSSPLVVMARGYADWYLPLAGFTVMLAAVAAWLQRRRTGRLFRLERPEWCLLVLVAAPILIHHAILAQWTARHAYSMVKTSLLVAVLVALAVRRLAPAGPGRPWLQAAAVTLLAGVLVHGVLVYTNDLVRSPDPGRFARLGAEIAARLDADHVAFTHSVVYITPQVVYYAKRNLQPVANLAEAKAWLVSHQRRAGTFFEVDRAAKVVSVTEVIP
jgi:hypothetical protein